MDSLNEKTFETQKVLTDGFLSIITHYSKSFELLNKYDTEDLSMSHLKELFISVVLLDNKYENAIEHLKGMKKTPKGKKQKEVGFGSH